MVFSGFVIAWRFAESPTFLSPPSINATIEGVVLFPSADDNNCKDTVGVEVNFYLPDELVDISTTTVYEDVLLLWVYYWI